MSFPLLRTIDCGTKGGGGYLESLRSATSIYSVRRILMHTRAHVQPHWSPCITGFYTLHWIFLSRTPSGESAHFFLPFLPRSYSILLPSSLPSLFLSCYSPSPPHLPVLMHARGTHVHRAHTRRAWSPYFLRRVRRVLGRRKLRDFLKARREILRKVTKKNGDRRNFGIKKAPAWLIRHSYLADCTFCRSDNYLVTIIYTTLKCNCYL